MVDVNLHETDKGDYIEINETKPTLSSEELGEIVEKGILKSSGAKGRGAKYFFKK
ncbi:hypothetical protein [Proteiniphilum acetatigenes]|uniref:hypothetical protein n=1 Tax=Proteiniphilum acetatigenes TaxID=294710 RepID=UPI00036BE7D5|nr:hypothetical protein [Proteiniphilum acetatigenes]